jgi:hypothetical protein
MWSVGLVFSELLLRACGRMGNLYTNSLSSIYFCNTLWLSSSLSDVYNILGRYDGSGKLFPRAEESLPRKQQASWQQKRLDFISQQIGPDKLKRMYCQTSPTQPLADLPVALDLLDRILRLQWQGEGARLSARDALAHDFFGGNSCATVRQCSKEEKSRFAVVRKRLQQLYKVRYLSTRASRLLLLSCLTRLSRAAGIFSAARRRCRS